MRYKACGWRSGSSSAYQSRALEDGREALGQIRDGRMHGLVEAIKNQIRKRIEPKTLEIPKLPQVASRILQLSQNPDTTIDEIGQVITTDPALATRILVIANSAAYGGGARIEGLSPALMPLGSRAVQDMVFAESVRMRIFSSRSYRQILEQSWKLSLGTAVACEALSVATGLERESAFLTGLLHDTGKPVLVSAVAECERQNGGASLGAEVVEILMSQLHEEIGAYVLSGWGVSPAIVSAAGAHHRYQGGAKAAATHRLVSAGNLVCQHLGIGDVQRDIDFSIEHVFADLELADVTKVSPILDTVTREVDSMMAGLHEAEAAWASTRTSATVRPALPVERTPIGRLLDQFEPTIDFPRTRDRRCAPWRDSELPSCMAGSRRSSLECPAGKRGTLPGRCVRRAGWIALIRRAREGPGRSSPASTRSR